MIVVRAVRITSKAANLYPVIFFPDALTSKLGVMGSICNFYSGKFSFKYGDVQNHIESSKLEICSKDRICTGFQHL